MSPMTHKRDRRCGFTMVELLVSLSVIVLLMGLILPAVQSAREASRRIQCQNNLRQFGVAIHNFETTQREYPRSDGPVIDLPPGQGWRTYLGYSPHVQLLPYLEQLALANDSDLQQGTGPGWDPRVRSSPGNLRLPLFFCPSDDGVFGTNYRGCTGDDPQEMHREHAGGIFGRVESTRPSDLTDGLSHTALLCEKLISRLDDRFDRTRDFWFTGLSEILPNSGGDVTAAPMVAYCSSLSSAPSAWFPYAGLEWLPFTFNDTLYNHVAPPNSRVPDCSLSASVPNVEITAEHGGAAFQDAGSFRATSAHPGGVFLLLADGAVRFVSDSIDINTWRALATIAGSETVGF